MRGTGHRIFIDARGWREETGNKIVLAAGSGVCRNNHAAHSVLCQSPKIGLQAAQCGFVRYLRQQVELTLSRPDQSGTQRFGQSRGRINHRRRS